jgi:hypothetical protein
MFLFVGGIIAALVPSAIPFGWLLWKRGIEGAPEHDLAQVLHFPRQNGPAPKRRSSAKPRL